MSRKSGEHLTPAQIAAKNQPFIRPPWPTEGSHLRDVTDGRPLPIPESWLAARAARMNGHAPTEAAQPLPPATTPTFHDGTRHSEAQPYIGTLTPEQITDAHWKIQRLGMLRWGSKPNSHAEHGERGESALLEDINAAVGQQLRLTGYTEWTTRELIAFTGYATGRFQDAESVHNLTAQEAQTLLQQAQELFDTTANTPPLRSLLTRVLLIKPGQALPAFWTGDRMEQHVRESIHRADNVVRQAPTLSETDGRTPGTFHTEEGEPREDEKLLPPPAEEAREQREDGIEVTESLLEAPLAFADTREHALQELQRAQAFLALEEVPGVATEDLRRDQEALARLLLTDNLLKTAGNDRARLIDAAATELDLTEQAVGNLQDLLVRGAAVTVASYLSQLAHQGRIAFAESTGDPANIQHQAESLAQLAEMGKVLLRDGSPLSEEERQAFQAELTALASQMQGFGDSPELLLTALGYFAPHSDEITPHHLDILSNYTYPSYMVDREVPAEADSAAQALVANVVKESNNVRDILLQLLPNERQRLAEIVGVEPRDFIFGGEVYDDIVIAEGAVEPTQRLLAWALRISPDLILTRDTQRQSLSSLDSSLYPVQRAIGMVFDIVEGLAQDPQAQPILLGPDQTYMISRDQAFQAIRDVQAIFGLTGKNMQDAAEQIRLALTKLDSQLPLHEYGEQEGEPSAADLTLHLLRQALELQQEESEEKAVPATPTDAAPVPDNHPEDFRTGRAVDLLRFGELHADQLMDVLGVHTPMEAQMQLASRILTIDQDNLSRKGRVIDPSLIALLMRLSDMREDMQREREEDMAWEQHDREAAVVDTTLTEQDEHWASVFEEQSARIESPILYTGTEIMSDGEGGRHFVAQFSNGSHVVLGQAPTAVAVAPAPTRYILPEEPQHTGPSSLPQAFHNETGAAIALDAAGIPVRETRREPAQTPAPDTSDYDHEHYLRPGYWAEFASPEEPRATRTTPAQPTWVELGTEPTTGRRVVQTQTTYVDAAGQQHEILGEPDLAPISPLSGIRTGSQRERDRQLAAAFAAQQH